MMKPLGLAAALSLLSACIPPATDIPEGTPVLDRMDPAVDRQVFAAYPRVVPLAVAACTDFIETGSFDDGPLLAAGYSAYSDLGPAYRVRVSDNVDFGMSVRPMYLSFAINNNAMSLGVPGCKFYIPRFAQDTDPFFASFTTALRAEGYAVSMPARDRVTAERGENSIFVSTDRTRQGSVLSTIIKMR